MISFAVRSEEGTSVAGRWSPLCSQAMPQVEWTSFLPFTMNHTDVWFVSGTSRTAWRRACKRERKGTGRGEVRRVEVG